MAATEVGIAFDSQAAPATARIAPSAATFFGFCLGAVVNAALIARGTRPWQPGQWLVHLADAAAFACWGFIAAAIVEGWARLPARLRRYWPLALGALAYAGAWLLLRDDVEHFSQRHSAHVPAAVLRASVLLVIASTVPGAAVAGAWLGRWRFTRWFAVAAAVGALIGNGTLLPADYGGIHLYAAWASVTLAGASLASWPVERSARVSRYWTEQPRWLRAGSAVVFAAALVWLCAVPLPAHATVSLSHSDGSGFYRLFAKIRRALRRSVGRRFSSSGEWFRDRSHLPPLPASAPRLLPANPIVILITVDALRADVINSGDYDDDLPTFTRIRNESVWFSEARAAATLTKLSVGALFTGTYFSQQYWTVREGGTDHVLAQDSSVRFSELLQAAHVRTFNFRSIKWLRTDLGFVRGFDEEEYVPYPKSKNIYTPSPVLFDHLLPELSKIGERPAFIYSHLGDAHAPYTLGRVRRGSHFKRYVSEVQVVDRSLARLLDVIDAPEFRDRTLLMISADHGEAFGEHGKHTHGNSLYDEILRVPLLIRLPSHTQRRIGTRVSLLDVAPTILDIMGQSTPGHFMGQSLVPFLRGENPRLTRPIAAETRRIQALVTSDGYKVIVNEREDTIELYNIVRDPKELDNLADSTELLERPLGELRDFFGIHRLRRPGYEPPYVR